MSWHQGRLAAFDLETTGVDSENDRIVTAAVSLVGGGLETESHSWLVNPGVPIPAGATAVHGITDEKAQAEGRPPAEAVEEITAILASQIQSGIPVIAFNARFDLTFMDREARRNDVQPLVDRIGGASEMRVIDPLVLDKQFDRFRRGKRTLVAACQHYGIQLDDADAHSSDADAIAAARMAWKLATTFPELGEAELADIHAQQIAWAEEQAASLEQYFRSKGGDETVERAWPFVPLAASNVS
ncbi:MAG: 3'-5' exonuclease [Thermoleophilaceae bacterium]|nr:3'-5' exonuclease [Thermoleophilaceae bacterium]